MLTGILMEVAGTVALKFTNGFTRWLPSVTACLCYALTFPLLMLALKKIPVGTAKVLLAIAKTEQHGQSRTLIVFTVIGVSSTVAESGRKESRAELRALKEGTLVACNYRR